MAIPVVGFQALGYKFQNILPKSVGFQSIPRYFLEWVDSEPIKFGHIFYEFLDKNLFCIPGLETP